MFFIPDSYSATVRIGARWRDGNLTTLDKRSLPTIRDGTFIELVIPAWAIVNDDVRCKLRTKRTIDMLPTDARVWLGRSRKVVPSGLHGQFRQIKEGIAAAYLLAEVALLESLSILVDGSERAKLNQCHCGILAMDIEATSLNHVSSLRR